MNKSTKISNFLISNIINRQIDLNCNTELFDSGIVDSFGLLELSFFIESEFNVKVYDYEIIQTNANTIMKITDLINAKL